jgi:hypothetical protein
VVFFEVQVLFDRMFSEMQVERGQDFMEKQHTAYLVGNPQEFSKRVVDVLPDKPDRIVGPAFDPMVAWLYDPHGLGLIVISQGASEEEVLALAQEHYNEVG